MPFLLDDLGHGNFDEVESFAERMVLFIQALAPFLPENGQETPAFGVLTASRSVSLEGMQPTINKNVPAAGLRASNKV